MKNSNGVSKKTIVFIIITGVALIGIMVIWGIISSRPSNVVEYPRPFKGNPEAAVVVTEFSDFECPACATVVPLVEDLAKRYQDKIKIEFREYPLTSIHPDAFNAALAAECAFDQGKFWEMHNLLFKNQNDLSLNKLKLYASQVGGLNVDAFNSCLDTKAKAEVVRADMAKGNSLLVNGTPTFFLNGEEVKNYNTLEDLINKELQSTNE